jgi:deoxyhypusine synthase
MIMPDKKRPLTGEEILPLKIDPHASTVDLIENAYFSFNAGRIRDICHLLEEKVFAGDVTVGLAISGTLTAAGLGISCIIPLIKKGLIDWIVATGANLYYDLQLAIGKSFFKGTPHLNDEELQKQKIDRIYDILIEHEAPLATDQFLTELLKKEAFRREMSSAELHYILGGYLAERERILGNPERSILSIAHQYGVPIITPSPGDSSIGMVIAYLALKGQGPVISTSKDVNLAAAIVSNVKKRGGKHAIIVLGGGSPKNFILQTENYLDDMLKSPYYRNDYFVQITSAHPDTGGLSGALPHKYHPQNGKQPESPADWIVAYVDSTVAFPLVTSYILSKLSGRPPRRLYMKLDEWYKELAQEVETKKEEKK